MAREVPWDAQTDTFVFDLNAIISKKYGVNFRSMLLNPNAYVNKKDIDTTIKNVKGAVDDYFSQLLSGLKDEQERLEVELENATVQYKQVDSIIASKSAIARVPYVKPLYVNRNPDNEETIVIDQYKDNLDSFIGKLVNSSNYVADVSATYKQYSLGSWLFSGAKNYILTINPPASPILVIENSSTIIKSILDTIASG
jgi:transcription termination factor NusB